MPKWTIVKWKSHGGEAHGKVVNKQTTPTGIKGHKVAASKEDPQYIVETDDGKRAAHKPDALRKEQTMAAECFKPTAKMADNARRGLELRERFGRGGTEVGVRRARQLVGREELEPADIKSMYSYFARHEVDKKTTRHPWGSVEDPSAGFIAWLLWGGDEGKGWVDCQRKKLS